MAELHTLPDFLKRRSVKGKTVLLRADLNVPMERGRVADDTRIVKIIPTIELLRKSGAKVAVLSHFGRPKGGYDPDFSLAPIADALAAALGREVRFGVDCAGPLALAAVDGTRPGEVVLLENLRFHPGEEKNDPVFAKQLAALGDFYVNDAFSGAHRAHASMVGVAELLPSCAGLLMAEELKSLSAVLEEPERPVAAIVGGAKVSTKIELLESLVREVDILCIGGGMANTFLYAQGCEVGASLCEKDMKKTVRKIIASAEEASCKLLLPADAMVAQALAPGQACRAVAVDAVPKGQMILDIGPETVCQWQEALSGCRTVVWNGPLGAFECPPFDAGTAMVARVIARFTDEGKLRSVAGGGDVLSALSKSGLRDRLTYISTAGGAFLEWLEGRELPGVKALTGA